MIKVDEEVARDDEIIFQDDDMSCAFFKKQAIQRPFVMPSEAPGRTDRLGVLGVETRWDSLPVIGEMNKSFGDGGHGWIGPVLGDNNAMKKGEIETGDFLKNGF